MSVLAPPPEQDDLELLIREARARQRRRRLLGAAAVIAILAGTGLAIHAIADGTSSGASALTGSPVSTGTSGARCGARVAGTNRILAPGGAVAYRDPYRGAMWHELRCSGPTVWAIFVNGIGTNVESYVGVRSLDGGRTWRVAFAQDPRVRKKYSIGNEVGPWALHGSRAAYFVATCVPCGVGKEFGTVSLTVTKNAGRTFHRYQVPALNGFSARRMQVTSRGVKIWATRLWPYRGKPRDKVVAVRS